MKEILTVEHAKKLLQTFKTIRQHCIYFHSFKEETIKRLNSGICLLSKKHFGVDLIEDKYIQSVCDGSYIYPLNPSIHIVEGMSFDIQLNLFFSNRIKALEYFILAGGYDGLDFSENAIDKIQLAHDTRN